MYNKQLSAFVKTAETGSFTKAAKLLYLTPASLIQQVNTLEEHLGVKLFERSPRGAVLTPEYAAEIGADFYAKDARESVEIAKKVLG